MADRPKLDTIAGKGLKIRVGFLDKVPIKALEIGSGDGSCNSICDQAASIREPVEAITINC